MNEDAIQKACADYLHMQRGDFMWFHPANGGKRHIGVAKKLKAHGVIKGCPDLCFTWATGSGYIELKEPHKYKDLKPEQKAWRDRCKELGIKWALCTSVSEVEMTIREWGLI